MKLGWGSCQPPEDLLISLGWHLVAQRLGHVSLMGGVFLVFCFGANVCKGEILAPQ